MSPAQLLTGLPPAARGPVAASIRSAFAAGLNDLLIVTGALALAGALSALLLIRRKAPAGGEQRARTARATSVAGEQAVTDGRSPVRSA